MMNTFEKDNLARDKDKFKALEKLISIILLINVHWLNRAEVIEAIKENCGITRGK